MRAFLRTLLAIDLVVLGVGGLALVADDDLRSNTGGGPEVAIEAFDPAAAANATLAQTTMRFEMTTSIEGLVPFDTIDVPSTGSMDLVNDRVEVLMDMGSMLRQLADAMGQDPTEDELASLGGEMRLVQDGSRTYMCGGFVATELGAECAVFDLVEFDPAFAELAGTGGSGGDPTAMLESLRGSTGGVAVGREEIRGVQTTHFQATQTLEDAFAAAPDPEGLRNAFLRLGVPESSFDDEQQVEVWIDDEGLVRRMRQTMDTSGATGGEIDGVAVSTTDFFDFGAPLDIVIPVDAVDITALLD